jgi:hypothetical protein
MAGPTGATYARGMSSQSKNQVTVERDAAGWVVRVVMPNKPVQTFHCTTEAMARQLVSAFSRASKPSAA